MFFLFYSVEVGKLAIHGGVGSMLAMNRRVAKLDQVEAVRLFRDRGKLLGFLLVVFR